MLILTTTITDVSGRVPMSAAFIAKETKDKAPEVGLELLARGVEDWQHRAEVLKWICFGSLPVLVTNVFCWAARHPERTAT